MSTNFSPPDEPSNLEGDLCPIISRQEIRKCISSFKRSSGSGHDGLLPHHLNHLTNENLGVCANDLLNSLCVLFNETILPGKVPALICPIFFGAKLIALSKKKEGLDL